MRTALPTDWLTEPFPHENATVKLDRLFSPQDMERLKRGFVPEHLLDKWFVYWQDDALHFHHSWTGFCTCIVHFIPEGDGYRMVAADINRDRQQCCKHAGDREPALISNLIDVLFLHCLPKQEEDGPASHDLALDNWTPYGRVLRGMPTLAPPTQKPGPGPQACGSCKHFTRDLDSIFVKSDGHIREVHTSRCHLHRDRTNPFAVHNCFTPPTKRSRKHAQGERKTLKP